MRIKFVIALALLASALVMSSCGERKFRLIQEQIEERIKKELPKRVTQEQVKRFISSFKSEFKVDERDYEARTPIAPEADAPETPESSYRGIVRARIREVGPDPKKFALFDLHLEFHFDEKRLLAGHKLETVGYH